jgi:hypothetical protein
MSLTSPATFLASPEALSLTALHYFLTSEQIVSPGIVSFLFGIIKYP